MKKKILFIDNEEDQRNLMHSLLTRFGYRIDVAEDTETALNLAMEEDYHLILIDLIMPDMDGTDLCEQIKRLRPGAVIYSVSGHASLYDSKRLESAGFNGHFAKPIRINDFIGEIETIFEGADPGPEE